MKELIETVKRVEKQVSPKPSESSFMNWADVPPLSAERFAEMHKAHLEEGTGVNDRE